MPSEIYRSNRIERLYIIQQLFLKQHQSLRTSELAEKLGVSEDTVLRDLTFLSSQGILSLVKDGRYWKVAKEAVYSSSDDQNFLEPIKHYDYDIALSYASEDRSYADAIAADLHKHGVKVFYDKYEKATLWGQDLYTYLSDIYQHNARYCLMFLSQHYAAKLWTSREREAAQARAFKERSAYILPIRLDDTEIPGILPTTAYLMWHQETVESIVHTILEKLEIVPHKSKQIHLDEYHALYHETHQKEQNIIGYKLVQNNGPVQEIHANLTSKLLDNLQWDKSEAKWEYLSDTLLLITNYFVSLYQITTEEAKPEDVKFLFAKDSKGLGKDATEGHLESHFYFRNRSLIDIILPSWHGTIVRQSITGTPRRSDLLFRFPSNIVYVVEVKCEDTNISQLNIQKKYIAQVQSYATGTQQVSILLVLDTTTKAKGVPLLDIREYCYIDRIEIEGAKYPNYVVVFIFPANRHLPSKHTPNL